MVGPQPPPSDDTDSESPSGEPHSATEDDGEGEEEHHQAMMAHLYQMLLARGYVPRGEADADAGPPMLPSSTSPASPRICATMRLNGSSCAAPHLGVGGDPRLHGHRAVRQPGQVQPANAAVRHRQGVLPRAPRRLLPPLPRAVAGQLRADAGLTRFVALLHERILRRCFTQNIDSLEAAAGLPADMVVAAHGNLTAPT